MSATLTPDVLGEDVAGGEIDTVLVVFTDLYGRFMGKRYDAECFLDAALEGATDGALVPMMKLKLFWSLTV